MIQELIPEFFYLPEMFLNDNKVKKAFKYRLFLWFCYRLIDSLSRSSILDVRVPVERETSLVMSSYPPGPLLLMNLSISTERYT